MQRDRIQFVLSKAGRPDNLSYHEMEYLFCFSCILYLRVAKLSGVVLDRTYPLSRDLEKSRAGVLQRLADSAPDFWELLSPYFPLSPDAHEENWIWKEACCLFQCLEREGCLGSQKDVALCFQELLYVLADSSSHLAECTSPRDIVMLVSWLMQRHAPAREGVTILDPACGAGSFLIDAVQCMASLRPRVSGFTGNRKIADLCSVGLALADGNSDRRIQSGSPASWSEPFDLVVSRIPFGQRQEHQHLRGMWAAAGGTGSVVAVIPNGVLFRSGKDAALRQQWVRENKLDTLIYLPENLLYATRIPASIVVLKAGRSQQAPVKLIDLSHGELVGRKRSRLSHQQLSIAGESILNDRETEPYCRLVTRETIGDNEYNLNRERYFSQTDSMPFQTAQSAVLEQIHTLQAELWVTQQRLEVYYDLLRGQDNL